MKSGNGDNLVQNDSAVANMIEYLMCSAVLMGLLVVMLLLVNTNIMQDPANRLIYTEFTDIGNGVSTRIVDVYAIAPESVQLLPGLISLTILWETGILWRWGQGLTSPEQNVTVYRGDLHSTTAIAGIAATKGTSGDTTGAGMNTICYNSSGITPGVKC